MAPSGGETALDQSERAPHLSDNRGLYRGASGGNITAKQCLTKQDGGLHREVT